MHHMVAQRFDQAQGAERHHLGSVFGNVERDLDVALRAEVIDLVGIDRLEHPAQPGAVGHIAIMQAQPGAGEMRIVVEVIDAVGIEQARPPHQAMHLIALGQQQLGQVGAVLAGDAGDQRALRHGSTLS